MRYTRYGIVLQQNFLPAVCAVIVAPPVCVGDGNGDIEGFCGDLMAIRSQDHNDSSIVAGFSNPRLIRDFPSSS